MNRISPSLVTTVAAATTAILVSAAPLSAQGFFGRSVAVTEGQLLVVKFTPGRGPAAVYVYEQGPDGWVETQRLGTEVTSVTGERIGPEITVAGDLALVGSGDPDTKRAAHVFRRGADGSWTAVDPIPMDVEADVRMDAPDGERPPIDMTRVMRILAPTQRFVATDGDRVLVSAVENTGTGGATLIERDPDSGGWRVVAELVPSSGDTSGGYGSALLLDDERALVGDRAFVGAPRQDQGAGAVYVYEATEDGWTETARIDGNVVGEVRRLGNAIEMDNGVLILGAPGAGDDAGVVIMLRPEADGTWEEVDRLTAPAEDQAGNRFGTAIDVTPQLWIGAPGADEGAGAVYRYGLDVEGEYFWMPLPEPGASGALGAELDGNSDLVAVGAPLADGGVGQVVIFQRQGETWDSAVIEPAGELTSVVDGRVRCVDGEAAGFACDDVNLLSFLTIDALGGEPGERVSDIWGWTDPQTGAEYALVGRSGGMVIVDLSRPASPAVVGIVPANSSGARDIKTYANHAFFTGDGAGEHGLVVFDLTRLRNVRRPASDETASGSSTGGPAEGEAMIGDPRVFEPDTVYHGIASAHNLAIDTESGFAFPVGSSGGGETCGGGLHMVDIRTPQEPKFAGCYTDTEGLIYPGRTHDTQCVVYHGPDEEYQGRQICFASNETALRIVDVTDKSNPIPISVATYPAQAYIHQGWLTEDHAWFYQDDELDELYGTTERTRTLVWNLADLDDPTYAGDLLGPDGASDHNLYIKDDRMYQANYQAGLRVVDISERTSPVEVGYFDTTPYGVNSPGFNGAWTAYPFFDSGTVIVSSMNEGLFVLRPAPPLVQ